MKYYSFLLIHILLFFHLLNPILCEDKKQHENFDPKSQSKEECLPGCANRLDKHCNKFDIELRATMTKCHNYVSPFRKTSSFNSRDTYSNVMKCGKKLHATLKILNQGETIVDNQYIIIDHVTDPGTGARVSLLNPYVIILKQKPIMQLYGLKHQSMVNGEAKEQVINKMNPEFNGCDDVSDTPTCGSVRYNGDIVPYSQGFCCSCDNKKNVRRQPRSSDARAKSANLTNFQNLMFNHMNWNEGDYKIREKKSIELEPKDFNDYRSSIRFNSKTPIIYVSPKKITREKFSRRADVFFKPPSSYDPYEEENTLRRTNRQEDFSKENVQVRGGQNCEEHVTPNTRVNPTTYDDSAHCLRFSKLWYAMYQLSDPVMEHSLYIKIFEKREIDNGNTETEWADLTKGHTINVGTLDPKFEDHNVLVTYDSMQQSASPIAFSLDSRTKRLLIPEGSSNGAEWEAGPSEYLVVDAKDVETSGEMCDTAGVGYSAFYNQPDRCSVQRGSCLKNQPSELWRQDKKNCATRRRGKYFLKNYATVPDDALRKTKRGDSNYLAIHFTNNYKCSIDIEIKADDNIVFRSNPTAKITEVYVDSTSSTATILTIKIHNNGLTSNMFRPRLSDCPLELPVDWGNLEGDPIVIPPQHHSTFTLRLLGILPVQNFYCTVEALSTKNEIVAVRRIRVVKTDRCICSWHCLCACYVHTGLGCVLMSVEHYKAAGFIGSMPLTTSMVQVSYLESVIFGFLFFIVLLVIILLIMGLTKALIGFCFFVPVGIWGLDMIIGLRPMDNYYEKHLEGRCVVYDEEGWPVHPDSRQRNVRIVEERIEFCLNIIFFFTYPIMLMILLCIKCCCPFYSYYGDEDRDAIFKGVSTVSYAKCSPSKQSSESEGNEDMFEFEEYDPYNPND